MRGGGSEGRRVGANQSRLGNREREFRRVDRSGSSTPGSTFTSPPRRSPTSPAASAALSSEHDASAIAAVSRQTRFTAGTTSAQLDDLIEGNKRLLGLGGLGAKLAAAQSDTGSIPKGVVAKTSSAFKEKTALERQQEREAGRAKATPSDKPPTAISHCCGLTPRGQIEVSFPVRWGAGQDRHRLVRVRRLGRSYTSPNLRCRADALSAGFLLAGFPAGFCPSALLPSCSALALWPPT